MAVTESEQWIGRVLGARYRLVASIASGGSGMVFLADDVRLRRQVAVKVLHPSLAGDPTFLRRFETEAQSVAALSHPHVLTVHDWGKDEQGPFLVSEYLSGGSLRTMLDSGARLSPAQAVKIGLETSAGLAAAHARGMLHRDIKPANLLFDRTGRLRIADFGLVEALENAGVTEPAGRVAGTVTYLAPERAGTAKLDGRTDVYSLALTLVESVSGRVPLSGGSVAEVLARRSEQPIEIPAEFGPAAEIIAAAGSPDPADRPFALELRDGLVESTRGFTAPPRLPLVGALPEGAPPYGGGEPTLVPASPSPLPPEVDASIGAIEKAPTPRWRPTRGLALLVALVLASLAVGAGFMVATVDPPRTPTHAVESYEGSEVGQMRAVAEANNWVLDEDQLRSDDVAAGTVLSQRPGPGSELAEGELLAVEVASGPFLVMMPTVLGLDAEAAVSRLEARGFVVDTVTPQFDEDIAPDTVLELTVDGQITLGGQLHEPGVVVSLVVSGGPLPRTVPRLTDQTVEEARAAVTRLRLELVEEEEREFSETVPEGVVIRQDVVPGIQVERGSSITVVVSKGPDRRAVPDVIGLTISEATRRLEEVGLTRSGVSGGGDLVEATDPAVGTLLRPGDEVLLWAPSS